MVQVLLFAFYFENGSFYISFIFVINEKAIVKNFSKREFISQNLAFLTIIIIIVWGFSKCLLITFLIREIYLSQEFQRIHILCKESYFTFCKSPLFFFNLISFFLTIPMALTVKYLLGCTRYTARD